MLKIAIVGRQLKVVQNEGTTEVAEIVFVVKISFHVIKIAIVNRQLKVVQREETTEVV